MIKIRDVFEITLPAREVELIYNKWNYPFDKERRMEQGKLRMYGLAPETYYCVLTMEKENDAAGRFFKKLVEGDKSHPVQESLSPEGIEKENSKKMLKFMVHLLKAYAELHFNAGYYHYDVKPHNLVFVITQPNGDYEPRLIDFDHTFRRTDNSYRPDFEESTLGFTPPEFEVSSQVSHLPKLLRDKKYEELTKTYKFSEEFKEEAFAVGLTTIKILDNNQDDLDRNDEKLQQLRSIASAMTNKVRDLRISTKKAYDRTLSLLKGSLMLI